MSEAPERLQAPQAKLLAVDDDPVFLSALETLLASQGLAVRTPPDPLRFWDALEEFHPDLLLLDLEMPGLDGVALCPAVRADARFAQVPVLFLTAMTDRASVQRIFEACADDYVSKPIVDLELLTSPTFAGRAEDSAGISWRISVPWPPRAEAPSTTKPPP